MQRARLTALAASLALPLAASAAVYPDTTGDNFDGNAHMDIASVEVTNTLTDITFKITVSGQVTSPDWGKYLVGISTGPANGDFGAPVGNPWGRNVNMANGMDAFIGSWADGGGGAQPWTYNAGWTQNGTYNPILSGSSTTITVPLASLGLSLGQTIEFDAYTTGGGGGDSANDAAANPSQSTTGWGGPYTTASGLTYLIAVPEPTSLTAAVLGLAGLAARRRRGV